VGDGDKPKWGKAAELSNAQASLLRVNIGPDDIGAMRPQAGLGAALHGRSHADLVIPQGDRDVDTENALTRRAAGQKQQRMRNQTSVAAVTPPSENPLDGTLTTDNKNDGSGDDGEDDKTEAAKGRTQVEWTQDAEAALLRTDLRDSIDAFSRAAKQGPLT